MSVRLPLAFVLGVATAVLVACGGGSNDKLIPAGSADQISSDLADLRQAIEAHDCQAANEKLSQVTQEVDNLPSSVDARLRRRLRGGVTKLSARVPVDCVQTTTETTPTTTETTPTTTETTPTTTETTPTTTETTPPTTTTPPETTTTDGGSGSGGVTAP